MTSCCHAPHSFQTSVLYAAISRIQQSLSMPCKPVGHANSVIGTGGGTRPPIYLIVTDRDRGVFAVERSMTDDRPWKEPATHIGRRIECGPVGANRDELAAEYRQARMPTSAPPGTILRPPFI
jgi:hypothetical protein